MPRADDTAATIDENGSAGSAATEEDVSELAAAVSAAARRAGATVAVAESLTSGSLACALGAAEATSEWFCGGIVAYFSRVKFELLGVTPGPVITASCAGQMAVGAAKALGAEFTVATTGAGGPGEEEGQPEGTTFVATHSPSRERVERFRFEGEPDEVLEQTVRVALVMLREELERGRG